jgi:hypothetical protein
MKLLFGAARSRSSRWLPLTAACLGLTAGASAQPAFVRDPLRVADSAKVTVSLPDYPGSANPNDRGWYHHSTNVVWAKDGSLIACYRIADGHTATTTSIVVARSTDGGHTWGQHQVIAKGDVWHEQALWVAPQMSVLKDGRLVVICDLGRRTSGQNWPMLTDWQKPDRGMANYLFISADNGHTWTSGRKIDEVGGEPGYILELSDGTLAYTRTSATATDQLRNPPLPWGNSYYRNEIVFSRDGGKTWPETHWLADSPFSGDCEVGLAELSPEKLMAVSRIGLGNAQFGHPSRILFSEDNGLTWPKAVTAPFYAQRPHVGRLQSGKYLVTYRNYWGAPGNRAVVFDPAKDAGFQPTSWIVDETCCELSPEALTIRTGEGKNSAVEFSLYPAQDDAARVEIEATLKVDAADENGCLISAGCWVHFTPDRVELADRPTEGFALDTRSWHTYRLVREKGTLTIFVDGAKRLTSSIDGIWVRAVRFGNRAPTKGNEGGFGYHANASVSHWKSIRAKVANDARDTSIDWSWTPARGYPDQFRRDHVVVLDNAYTFDCGYSSWTQLPDGRIVIIDYTNGGNLDSFSWGKPGEGVAPFVRAYLVNESDLIRQ